MIKTGVIHYFVESSCRQEIMHEVWADFNENSLHLWRRWEQSHSTILIAVPQDKITYFLPLQGKVFTLEFTVSRTVQLWDWGLFRHGDTFHFPKQEVTSHRVIAEVFVFPPVAPHVSQCRSTSLLEAKFKKKEKKTTSKVKFVLESDKKCYQAHVAAQNGLDVEINKTSRMQNESLQPHHVDRACCVLISTC